MFEPYYFDDQLQIVKLSDEHPPINPFSDDDDDEEAILIVPKPPPSTLKYLKDKDEYVGPANFPIDEPNAQLIDSLLQEASDVLEDEIQTEEHYSHIEATAMKDLVERSKVYYAARIAHESSSGGEGGVLPQGLYSSISRGVFR